jgi:hypothetical protein
MANFKMNGNDLCDSYGHKLVSLRSNDVRDANGHKVSAFRGTDLLNASSHQRFGRSGSIRNESR